MIPAFIAATKLRKNNDETVHMYTETAPTAKRKKKSTRVLNSKGGGSAPKMPSPREEAEAQILLEQEKARLAQEKATRDAAEAERVKQERIAQATGKQAQAYDYASNYGRSELANRGISDALADKYGIVRSYQGNVDKAKMGIAQDDLNPMAQYSTGTWLDNAIADAQGRYRNDLKGGVNSVAGDGFEYNSFADTSDDAILEAILTGQRENAMSQIDAAYARGQLNDVGLSKAKQGLETSAQAGMADLQSLGQGVLSGYRKELTGLRDNQLNKVGNVTFSDSYDPDAFAKLLTSRTGDMSNRLSGDIYKAVGNKTFFDPSTLISGAGALQGFYNPTSGQQKSSTTTPGAGDNPLLNAFSDEEKKKASAGGSTSQFNGAF